MAKLALARYCLLAPCWPACADAPRLLTLSILFFTIMLLEVDLGHRPALAAQEAWLALVPVVWLPISLLALMAVQVAPSTFTAIAGQIVMAVAAAVGMVGSGLHMMASGVDLRQPEPRCSRARSGAASIAQLAGRDHGRGRARLDRFVRRRPRPAETLPRDAVGLSPAVAAFILIVVGIGFAAVPWPMVMVSATCLALAALLLLGASLIGMLAQRSDAKDRAMIRNVLLALAAIVVIGAGFVVTFSMWRQHGRAAAFALGVPYTNFNLKTAHAQERGCNACHADHLAADVNRLVVGRDKPELHGIFATSYDIPMRVEDCLICHKRAQLGFAGSIHSLHLHSASFTNMGGNCDSCHGTTLDGKYVLYSDENSLRHPERREIQPDAGVHAAVERTIIRDLENAAKAD